MQFSMFYHAAVLEHLLAGQVSVTEDLFGPKISDALEQLWGERNIVIKDTTLDPPPTTRQPKLQKATLFQQPQPSSSTFWWPTASSSVFDRNPFEVQPGTLSMRHFSETPSEKQVRVAVEPPRLKVVGTSQERSVTARFWPGGDGQVRFLVRLALDQETMATLTANFAQLAFYRDMNVSAAGLVVTNDTDEDTTILFPEPVGLDCEVTLPPNLARFWGTDRLLLCGSLTYFTFWQAVNPWVEAEDPEDAMAGSAMVEEIPVEEEELEAWLVDVSHVSDRSVPLAGDNRVLTLHQPSMRLLDTYDERAGTPLTQAVVLATLRLDRTEATMLAHLTDDRALLTFRSLRSDPDEPLHVIRDAALLDALLHGDDWRDRVWKPKAYNLCELIDVRLFYHLHHSLLMQSSVVVNLPYQIPLVQKRMNLKLSDLLVTLQASFPTLPERRSVIASCEADLIVDDSIVFDAVVSFSHEPFATGYLEPGKVEAGTLARSSLLDGCDLRALSWTHDEFFLRALKDRLELRARASHYEDVQDAVITIPV